METNTSGSSNNLSNNNDINNTNELWKPNVFVLGPGGAKGYLELGLMLKFEQEDYLSTLKEFIGCSVGASIALLTVVGYTVTQIINDCIDMNLINDITDINIEHLTDSPGLLRVKTLENLLKTRVQDKFGMVPTLKQLYMATGILLIIVTFNLDKMRPEYLSKDTDPDLSSVEAAMMSMAVPALICPRIYKGNVYIDGAIGDPYPILHLDNGENDILGVYIDSEHSSHSSDRSIPRYLYRCAQASMKVLRDQAIKQASDRCKHIALRTPVMDTTGMSLTNGAKRAMIESGYKSATIFLIKIKDPVKYQLLLDDSEEIPIVEEIIEEIGDGINEGVLDNETEQMLNLLSNDPNETGMVFNNGSGEDLFVSDISVGSNESDEETIMIPITPEFGRQIERMRRCRQTND